MQIASMIQIMSFSLTLFFPFFLPVLASDRKFCFHLKTVTSVKAATFCIHSCRVQKLKQVLQMLVRLVQSVTWYFTKEREGMKEKKKKGEQWHLSTNGLKEPCSAVMASIRHVQQGKTGTFQTDGLKILYSIKAQRNSISHCHMLGK